MLWMFFQDALFSAIAAIGFAAVSRPARRAYIFCALLAAIGHSARFLLIDASGPLAMNIIPASFIAAVIVGSLAVFLSPLAKMPAETFLFPALLPMIPGGYACKSFGGLVMCILRTGEEGAFGHYFYLFAYNGLVCTFIILGMVIGATVPIFLFKKISFQATR